MAEKLRGLIAATLTPLHEDKSLCLDAVAPMVQQLLLDGVAGIYVCGSTGEGMSLTSQERMDLAAEFVKAAGDRLFVFVQVGHNSLQEARRLAEHAAEIGADAVSATCPSYFKVNSLETLIDCMREIASSVPDLPFFYYHIPSLTGNQLSMAQFLTRAGEQIQNLAGLKYTTPELHVFQHCRQIAADQYQVFWGTDEMLLPALSVGAEAAIGSTYNIAAPLYAQLIEAFQRGDLTTARERQLAAVKMIDILLQYPFQSALKYVMSLRCKLRESDGLGGCRLPLGDLSSNQKDELRKRLEEFAFLNL